MPRRVIRSFEVIVYELQRLGRSLGLVLAAEAALLTFSPTASAQLEDTDVLIVVAHPDDDAMFAGSVYRLTHELGGRADLLLVTDGAGGYRFSTLAEPIYGLRLTDPDVARRHLPAIRKKELMAGGEIVGIANYFFLDQPDTGKILDADSILSHLWDRELVASTLDRILSAREYDFIYVHLPREVMHAHHKAATILALEAAGKIPEDRRPVVLGGWITDDDDTDTVRFAGLANYPVTSTTSPEPLFAFDRTATFGLDGRLNYKIVANWLIAEHKSQGTMQGLLGRGDREIYWIFDVNGAEGVRRATRFFDVLMPPGGRPAPED